MSNQWPRREDTAEAEGVLKERPSPIRVLIADTQSIYRVGMRKILTLENDIRVVALAESLGQAMTAASRFPCDVVLFEAALTASPNESISELIKRFPSSKVIVLHDGPTEEDTVDLLRRGASGIIFRSISPELLVRCVRKVAEGETWLDNRGVNWVIDAYRNQISRLVSSRPKGKMSDKEMLIISCVTQGLRNKEIAVEIGTTEQVIKNYLRKIYEKLGVSDRLELALYCIHHRLLQGHSGSLSKSPTSEIDTPVAVLAAVAGHK